MSLSPTEKKFCTAALEYLNLGFSIVPVSSAQGEAGKRPYTMPDGHPYRWRQEGALDTTEKVIDFWQQYPDARVGIIPPLGVQIVDIDCKNGVDGLAELKKYAPDGWSPETCESGGVQITGSGGYHLFFQASDATRNNGNRDRWTPPGVDIRGDGRGYVLAGPSTHPVTGKPYEWLPDNDLCHVDQMPPVPDWLGQLHAKWIAEQKTSAPQPQAEIIPTHSGDRCENVLVSALNRVRSATNGTRNEMLNREAFGVAGVCTDEGRDTTGAREALAQAGRDVGLREHEINATLNSAFSAGEKKPLFPREQIRPSEQKTRSKNPVPLFPLTDAGNGERMAMGSNGKIRFCPPRKRWLLERGGRWFWDETRQIVQRGKENVRQILREASQCTDDDMRKAIVTHARRSENLARLNAMISFAETEPGIPVMPDELDASPFLLGCRNGTLNLQTGKLQRNNPADLITKSTTCDYDPGARSELWNTTLATMTGHDSELANYLQRVVGYSLFGEVREKHFWFLYGPPDGGKSTFINAIVATMGDYARGADFNTWLVQTNTGGNRGDIVDLMGSRLVVSVEARKGARFDESIIKKITGGDRLKFAAKYEREVEFTAQFALVLAANDAPVIRDDDEGVWSRVCRVPFTHPIPKNRQDKALGKKLATSVELSAILTWAVEGFRQWQDCGLGTCKAVETSNATYRREMDRVEGFFEELCVFNTQEKVATRDLKQAYEHWAADMGVYALNGREFNARLQAHGCIPGRVKKAKGWQGVRLRTEFELQNPNLTLHDGNRGAQNDSF